MHPLQMTLETLKKQVRIQVHACELDVLRWFQKLASDEQSRTFCGREFQVVRAEMREPREPSERLWRGTVSS